MEDQRIYMAGPIQHVGDYGKGWRERLKQTQPSAFDWVDPMDKYNTMEEASDEWTSEDIVIDDLKLIDSCDGVLVHWEAVPTCGTPMEVFYTYRQTDMPVVIQSTLSPEDMSPWMEYHAHAIVESFDEAIEALEHLIADREIEA